MATGRGLAERTHVASVSVYLAETPVILAIVDGHLETALEWTRRLIDHADEAGAPLRGRQVGLQLLLAPALYLGRPEIYRLAFEEYARHVPTDLQAPGFIMLTAAHAISLVQLGRTQEARSVAGPLLDRIESCGDAHEPINVLNVLLQAAVVFREREAAQTLAARLLPVADVAIGEWFLTSVARQLGDAAALVGDRVAAHAYFLQALDAAGKIRFRPELALTHLRVAELLAEEADRPARSTAQEHLEIAIPELQDMHMQPALERALALSNTLQPSPPRVSTRPLASDTLTAREREIVSLIASGLSNRQIAERLVISSASAPCRRLKSDCFFEIVT